MMFFICKLGICSDSKVKRPCHVTHTLRLRLDGAEFLFCIEWFKRNIISALCRNDRYNRRQIVLDNLRNKHVISIDFFIDFLPVPLLCWWIQQNQQMAKSTVQLHPLYFGMDRVNAEWSKCVLLARFGIMPPRCIHSRGYSTRGGENLQDLYRRFLY